MTTWQVGLLALTMAAPLGAQAPKNQHEMHGLHKDSAAYIKALEDPVVLKRLQEAGVDPTPGRGPKQTTDFIKAELAKWAPIIKASGAQVTN